MAPDDSSPDDATAAAPLVAMHGITKAYPGVLANDRVDLTLAAGRVHALLGENGAGKSTLVKILYGLLQPDAGRIVWKGREIRMGSPAEARRLGIGLVFQHFSLFESMTVLENIALGMALDADAALAARISEVSTRYGLPLDPARPVHTLSVGARQRIEICRCLLQEPALLIMDEPTSVLTPQEVAELFATLGRLAKEGTAILYISHKLDEIRRLCDEATILRAGRRVAGANPATESAASLAALMMGTALAGGAPAATLATLGAGGVDGKDAVNGASGAGSANGQGDVHGAGGMGEARAEGRTGAGATTDTAARATARATARVERHATARLVLDDVSLAGGDGHASALHGLALEVAGGEIVGIAGVAGNGQDELMGVIGGEARLGDADALRLDRRGIGLLNAGARRELGLCTVPEERLGHAAVPTMTLTENAFLTGHHRRPLRRLGLYSASASRRFADEIIERFDVRCNGPSSLAGSLSGGNLQKFVVGREILQAPGVLVVAQPTWGVDAGAAAVIHAALRELAAAGSAVLVVSQDLDELLALTGRIGALCAGRLSAFHRTASVGAREVGLLMGGEALAA